MFKVSQRSLRVKFFSYFLMALMPFTAVYGIFGQEQVEVTLSPQTLRIMGYDPYRSSNFSFQKVKDALGDLLYEATKELKKRVRSGEITGGQALHQIFMNVAQTSAQMVREFMPIIAGLVALGVASYGAKRGFDILKEWAIMRMNTPALLREIVYPYQIKKTLNDLHYTGETSAHIKNIITMAKNVAQSGGRAKFENVMLWGNPGTGKTAVLEIIAKEAGMVIFKTTGGDFAKLRGKDLQQIDQIFRKARSSRKPVLFFIDEMEELFGSRDRKNLSEESRQVLSKLLAEFSEPSSQIMLIGATNRPQDIDEAMHRRMPQQIEVGLPDHVGRVAILNIYKRTLFTEDKKYKANELTSIRQALNDAMIDEMAKTVGTISPAELQNIMITLKNRSFIYNKGIPTRELIISVIREKLNQLKARSQGFVRSSDAQTNV